MTATAAALAGARRLYIVAGLAAFLAMLANVVDIVICIQRFADTPKPSDTEIV